MLIFPALDNPASDGEPGPTALAEALQQSEARLQAFVSNIPGLVYQFRLHPDNSVAFPYLSNGCHALLGINPAQLQVQPSLLLDMVLEEDRQTYQETMASSAAEMTPWNWEGRLWIEEWKDIKWVNLRATPPEPYRRRHSVGRHYDQHHSEQAGTDPAPAFSRSVSRTVGAYRDAERKRTHPHCA